MPDANATAYSTVFTRDDWNPGPQTWSSLLSLWQVGL